MNYGRIQRGPMAADAHFTQISNTLFRDNRLSFRDKGVFGLISTHRDGFGVTAESIAACSPTDGVTSVKTSLRNLETYGYLKRTRVRRPDGTLGGAVYFITDDPQMHPGAPKEAQGLETPSSEPTVAQPPLAEPTQVEPTLAGPALVGPTLAELLHKNTNSKHTSPKKTLSPPPLGQEPQEPSAPVDEREISPPGQDADLVLAAYAQALGRPVSAPIQVKIRDQTGKLLADGFPAWWIADRARELPAFGTDLAKHCEMSTVPVQVQRPGAEVQPCKTHDPFDRMVRDPATGDHIQCPACHPTALARARRQGAA